MHPSDGGYRSTSSENRGENATTEPKTLATDRRFHPQALPGDILALIVEALCLDLKELFAPLICSRVCSHWRCEIFSTPSLWSFIDTSRGQRLTDLWVTNSRESLLDVRLCDPPLQKRHLEDMQSHSFLSSFNQYSIDLIPRSLMNESRRWKSLDISLSCTCRVSKVLEFLGQCTETIYLDSLTIGPMGRTTLVLDDISTNNTFLTLPPLADRHLVPPHFETINVQPVQLHVDTYLLRRNTRVFSPRLTVLEVFLGAYLAYDPDHVEWHSILSSVPNLVELSLWDPRYDGRRDIELPDEQMPVELRSLRVLKLSGRFIHITELLARSLLPNLRYFLLDSIDTTIAILPMYLSKIATVSPQLDHVSIGSMSYVLKGVNAKWWAEAFQTLRTSLREFTFVEMEWLEVALALDQLIKHAHMLSRLRLEGVWDMELYDWTRLQSPGREMPRIEFINSMHGGASWCKSPTSSVTSWGSSCKSEAMSNCQ